MSHVVSVKVVIRDLNALEMAAKRCGLELHRGQRSYRWFGRWVGDYTLPQGFKPEQLGKCDHALTIPGNPQAYEVGVVQNADGTCTLLYDFWAGGYGLEAAIGKTAKKLTDEYSWAVVESKCTELCWMTQREGDALRVYHPDGGSILVTPDGKVDAIGFQGRGCEAAVNSIASALGLEVSSQRKPEYALVSNKNNVIAS
ncbi:MAG: DUF2997 domain-containing protein [Acidobacteria bacterium]|nr:DUF2997 domain-containing protein [Acidobacteriota bacterium]